MKTVTYGSEAAILVLGALSAAKEDGWDVKAARKTLIASDGVTPLGETEDPEGEIEAAASRAQLAMQEIGASDGQKLVLSSAVMVALMALEQSLGQHIPEIILTALAVLLDPLHGLVSKSPSESLDIIGRAFCAKEKIEQLKPVQAITY